MTKLLRLPVRCWKCRSWPALRIAEDERDRYQQDPPEKVVGTIQCRCGEVVELRAQYFQEAA